MARKDTSKTGSAKKGSATAPDTNPAAQARVAMEESARAQRDALSPQGRANLRTHDKTTSRFAGSEGVQQRAGRVSYRRFNSVCKR